MNLNDDFPVKNKNRAKRRHHRQRMLQKAKRIFNKYWSWGVNYSKAELNKKANKEADNLAICSCFMCQYHEKSLKEKAEEIKFKEQLEEVNQNK